MDHVVMDGGQHPNPRKAAEGDRLRVLAIDEPSAEVVQRIFAEYLDGTGTGRSLTVSTATPSPPKATHLPEAAVLTPLNTWLGALFDPNNLDRTVTALVASQDGTRGAPNGREAIKKRLADAETRLRRFHTAIGAGVDPAALVEAINDAQAQRTAAQAELDGAPARNALTEAEVYAMIDYLGDVGHALNQAEPAKLHDLYEALRLEMTYDAPARAVDVTIRPTRRDSERVRGRS